MSQDRTLADWLHYLETLHVSTIDLGLDRVRVVKEAMGLDPDFPVITVGGTNGKGSVCAMLSKTFACAGFRVGTYASPHLLRYNERIAIDTVPLDDAAICRAFAAIEAARGDTPLTYFEFGTLAAMWNFIDAGVDVAVMEVGLGGRLDAVNLFEPDCSLVVSVDLDHQDWLGDTRELIGFEKAGIYRAGRPAICADPNPPQSLLDHAAAIGADLRCIGRDFGFTRTDSLQWEFWHGDARRHCLPTPALRGGYQMMNATAALAVLEAMKTALPVGAGAIRRGLLEVEWPGRFQVLPGRPVTVMDVGHNPHAMRAMVASLQTLSYAENRYAVFSMLADKDIDSVIELAKSEFDVWYVAPILDTPRGLPLAELQARLAAHGVSQVKAFPDLAAAWSAVSERAGENDRIAVFGSFHTVAAVMAAREQAA
ncbi:bifunctional tetrahydrofolate synthase/dihydrofolate synthase [Microvirgula aerodenitrificans]|uniref:bifunctional tetrahydrofolate synthase/dihydrofolate synthase n=1 Tax=Microvirgula aerodenitrificans TaxID=57480 RepID=UPI0028E80AE5|nr:bifunctional tetrahydrofolate synthase/dihydrofolate synthase [Microvirgula aerodenitrificans]